MASGGNANDTARDYSMWRRIPDGPAIFFLKMAVEDSRTRGWLNDKILFLGFCDFLFDICWKIYFGVYDFLAVECICGLFSYM